MTVDMIVKVINSNKLIQNGNFKALANLGGAFFDK